MSSQGKAIPFTMPITTQVNGFALKDLPAERASNQTRGGFTISEIILLLLKTRVRHAFIIFGKSQTLK